MEPGDKEQEQTHAAEEWHNPRATQRCSREQEQTCEDGLPPGGLLVAPGTRSLARFRRHTEFCVTVQSRKAWSLIWTGSNILSLHAITQNSVWHLFSQTNMQTRNDRSPSKISKLSKYLVWQSTLLGMNMEKNGGQQCEEPKPPPAAPMEAAPS